MWVRRALLRGLAIPAHPLALTAARRLDERRQRALSLYYLASGAGGLAVGVHTTQFAIHEPRRGLLEPVLRLALETARSAPARKVMIAGVIGYTARATREAELAALLGYDAVLLSLGALKDSTTAELIAHARAVAAIAPVMGFYLQPAVGGRVLDYAFWRRFAEIENVVGIKIAPFDRYATGSVIRAVIDSGRSKEIALYTGNDDHIILDLVSQYSSHAGERVRMTGGLLGHWAFWTRTAVEHHADCKRVARRSTTIPARLVTLAAEVTDANGAVFDAANAFRGCIPGIHEILRRQRLLAGRWCLDHNEELSPGQAREIDRVRAAYPHLADDEFVAEHLDEWMS